MDRQRMRDLDLLQLSLRAFAYAGVPYRREEIDGLQQRLADVIDLATEEAAERRRATGWRSPADLEEAKRAISAARAPEE